MIRAIIVMLAPVLILWAIVAFAFLWCVNSFKDWLEQPKPCDRS